VETIRTNRRVIIAAFAAGIALQAAPAWAGSAMNAAAPAFELPTRAGGHIGLDALRGQVVMINFWASWCGPCRQEFPILEQMYRKYGPMGFSLIAVNVESDPADSERFLAKMPVSFPIAYDAGNVVSDAYGVSAMPTTLIIDRKGKVRWMHRAYKPGDENEYLDQLRAMLREAP
jgi:thiol-disulfide isomerase/thioredoxin